MDPSAGYHWIKAQPQSNFTIQLFAFAHKKHALSYVKSNDLNGDVVLIQTGRDRNRLYKGLYGSYVNTVESERARHELAARMPTQAFWLRQFSDIVRDIEDGHEEVSTAARNAGESDSSVLQSLQAGQSAFNRQKYRVAYEMWEPLAKRGVAEAQYGLGFMFESGWGVEKDYAEAVKWYRMAARQGHAKSQYNLGILYIHGLGVEQDQLEGRRWIEASAQGSDRRALDYIEDNL